MKDARITRLDSREVYKNHWLRVREDAIRRPSGAEGIYGVVEKPDFAVIAAIEGDSIYLVQQYRYTVGGRYWEMPQGAWEQNPDADPEDLARGELREETGLVAGCMTALGYQYLAYGFCDQGYHIYVAQDLVQAERQLDPEEEDLIVRRFTLAELEDMILCGVVRDATTVNAYGWLKLRGII